MKHFEPLDGMQTSVTLVVSTIVVKTITSVPKGDDDNVNDEAKEKSPDLMGWRQNHCPLDKDSLGRATWGLVSEIDIAMQLSVWMSSGQPILRLALQSLRRFQLHTTAAYYPDKPTPEQQVGVMISTLTGISPFVRFLGLMSIANPYLQAQATSFIKAVGEFYPCSYCAKDFRKCIKKHPPEYVYVYGQTQIIIPLRFAVIELLLQSCGAQGSIP